MAAIGDFKVDIDIAKGQRNALETILKFAKQINEYAQFNLKAEKGKGKALRTNTDLTTQGLKLEKKGVDFVRDKVALEKKKEKYLKREKAMIKDKAKAEKKEIKNAKEMAKFTDEEIKANEELIDLIKEQTREMKERNGVGTKGTDSKKGFVRNALGKTGRGLGGLASRAGRISGWIAGIGALVGGATIVDSTNEASDLMEERQKIQDVYADLKPSEINKAVREIQGQYDKKTGKRIGGLGLSEYTTKQMLGLLGDIVQGVGIQDQTEALAIAKKLSKEAINIKSFKNAQDLNEVVLALSGLLTNERERLKTFGYVVREADVKERAIEIMTTMLQKENGDPLVKSDYKKLGQANLNKLKLYSSLDIMFGTYTGKRGLTKAADDNFLKTQDSYANAMLAMQESIKDKQGAFGMSFMKAIAPEIQNFTEWLNSISNEDIERWTQNIVDIMKSIKDFISQFIKDADDLASGKKNITDFAFFQSIEAYLKEKLSSAHEHFTEAVTEVKEGIMDKVDNFGVGSLFGLGNTKNRKAIRDWERTSPFAD